MDAGNRTSDSANPGAWAYDNKNQMTASPGRTYAHDLVGNRATRTIASGTTYYGWDLRNRMTAVAGAGVSDGYASVYRVDGMRVRVRNGISTAPPMGFIERLANVTTTRTYYDGQMPVEEDVWLDGVKQSMTRNFPGLRGTPAIETNTSGGASTVYPVYDTHGNMVATIAKQGSGFALGSRRILDAWGNVLSGTGPKNAYCANLGHVSDAESGLTYMSARYGEPTTGTG